MNKKQFLTSMIVILLMAVVVMGVAWLLHGPGTDRYIQEKKDTIHFMLTDSDSFTEELDNGGNEAIEKVYKGQSGYVIEVVTQGYAGPVRTMVGVDNSGSVQGITVRDMQETLGLGTQALTDYEFLMQFLLTRGDAEVGENVDAMTGATVTSKAIARAVNIAVGYVTGADTSSGATSWGG